MYGPDHGVVRVDTIHAVKGEEADMVLLVSNITGRTERAEEDDEDEERRVWFVGASRARETLMLTRLSFSAKATKIL
jgi:superfamily I DNA/RNA helicase